MFRCHRSERRVRAAGAGVPRSWAASRRLTHAASPRRPRLRRCSYERRLSGRLAHDTLPLHPRLRCRLNTASPFIWGAASTLPLPRPRRRPVHCPTLIHLGRYLSLVCLVYRRNTQHSVEDKLWFEVIQKFLLLTWIEKFVYFVFFVTWNYKPKARCSSPSRTDTCLQMWLSVDVFSIGAHVL